MKTFTLFTLIGCFLYQFGIAQSNPDLNLTRDRNYYEELSASEIKALISDDLVGNECLIVINHFLGVDELYNIKITTVGDELIEYHKKQGNPITISGIYEKSITSIVLVNDESKMEYELLEMMDLVKSSCPIAQRTDF